MRLKALTALLALAGCGPVAESDEAPPMRPLAVVRDAIVGGTATRGDPNVFMLLLQGNNGQGSLCTATLIDTRSLLTAAHCVDPRILGATSLTIYATNAPTESEIVLGRNAWQVRETRMHPTWNPNTLTGDIAMALLEAAPSGVTAKPWSSASLQGYTGRPVRAVGYGTVGNNAGSGVKRTVDLTLRALTGTNIYLGNQTNKGICHGDSGGPTFHTFADGVERVIGVHSFTVTEACTDGADTRVDVYASFVQQWLNDREAPTCGYDGRCKAGCAPVDVDCVCRADGQCTAQCTDLSKDPDCPADCGTNGVCSTQACPVPDADCVAEGQPCTSATQCVARRCVVDPQHLTPYCSRPCGSGCATGMECDAANQVCVFQQLPTVGLGQTCTPGQSWCGANATCTGVYQTATACALKCSSTPDCPDPQRCVQGWDGTKFCQEPARPPVLLTLATGGGPAASGCASVPGGALAALALLGLLRRRR